MKKILVISALCSTLLLASSEVDELKMQLQKQSEMIKKLTQRLDAIQTQGASKEAYAENEKVPEFSKESIPAFENNVVNGPITNTSSFAQPQYVPNISLVVDTSFVARNKSQDDLNELGIPGIGEGFFGGDGHDGHSHSAPNAENGFNFNYAELVLSSNVDPFFSMDAVIHFNQNDVEIEEAYFTTTALEGIRLRGGKFFSEFGRMNKQHHHAWSFSDQPLIYQGFLGSHGINEVGVQLQYTAPIDTYLMVGAEVLQGENEASFGNESAVINVNAISPVEPTEIEGGTAPSMIVGYVKSSFDVGNTTILPGASYVYGNSISAHAHEEEGEVHEAAFSGHTSLYNLELTIKHYFDSYSFLAWQSEWMRREQDGTSYHVHDEGTGAGPETESEDQKIRQEGLYSQVVYGVNQNWRTGVRYDSIYKNDIGFVSEGGDTLPSTPYERYSAMVEYHFSEFSRLRLQYNFNEGLYTGDAEDGFAQEDIHSMILSFNFAIGAHGAHDF